MKKLKTFCVYAIMVSLLFSSSAMLFADGIKNFVPNQKDVEASIKAARKHNDSMKYVPPAPFKIYEPGTDTWIDYEKYGEFQNLGTEKYKYVVKDFKGLQNASGEGIYPNNLSVTKSPDYEKFINEKKLEGSHWNFVNADSYQINFYKWATIKEDPGVKLYYTAYALDKAGNYKHAVKAYYACLVFFPKAIGYTQWKTPWYIGPVCMDRIQYLTKKYPEIGVRLEGASITIENRWDNDPRNDVFHVNPGKLVKATKKDFERKYVDLSKVGVKKVTGTGRIKLTQYENNHFQLTVDENPYLIRAICYSPTPIGLSPDNGSVNTDRDWSDADKNKNGLVDGPYEAWVDANRNEIQDANEKNIGDFALMKAMGINTIRLYHYPNYNKDLLKNGYENYGFMYMVGNLVGMYGADAGADWFVGTDYTNKQQCERMLASVRKMVEEFKDEPYVLLWILGNENNYGTVGTPGVFAGTSNQAQRQPEAYYTFINECVKLIKSIDPLQRPVAICNGDTYLLDYCAKYAPELDIYGANAYRGDHGFGPLWKDVMHIYKKPVLVTEFGCPAYAVGWDTARIEAFQANYHHWNWTNLEDNMAGVAGGVGNALGGVVFEWVDEWWKAGPPPEFDPFYHDLETQWIGPFLDGGAYEEWFGICSQGDGKDSPFKRQIRKAFFTYYDLWEKYKKNK